ncbi:type III pantothenate kinase [Prochlorococcus marinus]|uniref:type III pantothenate kinase n=1 Tax=Prochlorococcus marinus TaxID=1219 RepID=UPI0022B4B8FB|nr:type III pantothenate kinase [Prochlorococcus marinus]
MYSEENYLMIGNTRWHWASKIKKDWKFFHTSPNPIEFKDKDYSKLTWASVGPIPEDIKLCPSKKIILDDIPLNNLPASLGIDRALASWSAFKKYSSLKSKEQDFLVIDAGTILSVTKITNKGDFAGGQLISGFRLQLSSMGKGALNLETPIDKNIPTEIFQYETHNAMIRGSINGLIGFIMKIFEETKLPIWMCGGDAPIILNELKNTNIDINHCPNLVLEGMIDINEKINSI